MQARKAAGTRDVYRFLGVTGFLKFGQQKSCLTDPGSDHSATSRFADVNVSGTLSPELSYLDF